MHAREEEGIHKHILQDRLDLVSEWRRIPKNS